VLDATAGDDLIEVSALGGGYTGTVVVNAQAPKVNFDNADSFTVNGGAGFNVLNLLGTEGADTAFSGTSAVTVNSGRVTLGTGISLLDVTALGGDDAVFLDFLTTARRRSLTADWATTS